MNEAKFTPGPWSLETVKTQVGHCHKVGPFGVNRGIESYCCLYVDGLGLRPEDRPEQLANARLVAAAPELYGACEVTLKHLIELMEVGIQKTAPNSPEAEAIGLVGGLIRSALKKARGEQ